MANHARWYDNPDTGLPTIRRAPGVPVPATPEQVRAWMQDGTLAPAIEPEDDDHCPTCGQSTDEEEDPNDRE